MTLPRSALATNPLIQNEANSIASTDYMQHFLQIVNASIKHNDAKTYYSSVSNLPTAVAALEGMVATVYYDTLVSSSINYQGATTENYDAKIELHLCTGSTWVKIFDNTSTKTVVTSSAIVDGSSTTKFLLGYE